MVVSSTTLPPRPPLGVGAEVSHPRDTGRSPIALTLRPCPSTPRRGESSAGRGDAWPPDRRHPVRCSFCHDSLASSPATCRDCKTALHRECWELAGDCPTLGCEGAPRESRRLAWYLGWLLCLLPALHELKPQLDLLIHRPYHHCCICACPRRGPSFVDRPPGLPDPITVVLRHLGSPHTQLPGVPPASPADGTILQEIRERRRRRA